MNFTKVFSLEGLIDSIFIRNILVPVMLIMWISMLVKIAQDCIVFIITYAHYEEDNGHGDGGHRENAEEGGQGTNWRVPNPVVSRTRSYIYRRQKPRVKRPKRPRNLSDTNITNTKNKDSSDLKLRSISAQTLRDLNLDLENSLDNIQND